MPGNKSDLWGNTDAYENYMGRWSKKVAPLFFAVARCAWQKVLD